MRNIQEPIIHKTIKLIPYKHEIKELSVEARDKRKENLKLFKKAFIGTGKSAIACRILNDSVLSFRWDSMIFSASAHQPLIIDNSKLGYRINIILQDFKLIYDPETYQSIRKGNKLKPEVEGAVYQMLCNNHFIPYPSGKNWKQDQIENARLRVYYGSRMHFLRALYSGDPKEHGYLIRPEFRRDPSRRSRDVDTLHDIKISFLDPLGKAEKLLYYPEKSMVIQFFYDYSGRPVDLVHHKLTDLVPLQSELTFTSNKCIIRYNGTTFDYSMLFTGYIGERKISTLLPDDFMLDE